MEEETATHSSILAWRISRTEEPGGLQSMGLQRVGHDGVSTNALTPQLVGRWVPLRVWEFRSQGRGADRSVNSLGHQAGVVEPIPVGEGGWVGLGNSGSHTTKPGAEDTDSGIAGSLAWNPGLITYPACSCPV